MDGGAEAGVGFVGAHSDTFELLQLAEEVLDQVTPFVHVSVDRPLLGSALMLRDDDLGARSSRSAMMALLSKAVSAISALKLNPSISGGTPIVSNRWPGSRTKRTRFPRASVSARILVVRPPLDRPMAWL